MKAVIKKWLPYIGITFFFIGLGCAFYLEEIEFLEAMEMKALDLRFNARGPIEPGPEVVLAVVDEKSLAKEGRWVWPRSKIAQLINKLSDAGAAVVAFDMGFLEPDNKALLGALDSVDGKMQELAVDSPALQEHLQVLKTENDNDRLLAEAITNSSAAVVLGHFFQVDPEEAARLSAAKLKAHKENASHSKYKIVKYLSEEARDVILEEATYPQSNIAEIADSAYYSGFFNVIPDRDGVVRRARTVVRFDGDLYAPLSVGALSAYFDTEPQITIAPYVGVWELVLDDYYVPTDEIGRLFINFRGPEKTFPHISITDILRDEVNPEQLLDKIVLVGATATGIYDIIATPFQSIFPGLETHANIIDNILAGDFIYMPELSRLYNLLAIVGWGLALGIVLPLTGVYVGALTGIMMFAGHIFLCQYMFTNQGFILNLIYPLNVIAFIYVAMTAYRFLAESKQKRFIRGAFSTYLAPSVVKQLIDSPQNLDLGGEEREITAFFSDVQGFTSISEKLTPPQLVELLNEFLTDMTDIILKYEGTVDKFEGDAIIAFFGAPNILPDHARRAGLATAEMQQRLVHLREQWKTQNKPQLHMRVGLATGKAVVGNMGSKSRMDYTMMGDTVNTAARLEGVNKVYGIYCMINDETHANLGEGFVTREVDAINVVGKGLPVTVYQIIGQEEEVEDDMRQMCGLYAEGLAAYRVRDWDRAITRFEEAQDVSPEDGPSRTMKTRCEAYKLDPPPPEWDGGFTMTSK